MPFNGFSHETIGFMLDLRFNNNKAFMQAHRDEYIAKVRDPYYALIEALAPAMRQIDPQMEVRPLKVLSRIFRDTRFSRDKAPYRDHHWLAFRRAGLPREAAPMFWAEIRVERVTWGLGFWGDNREALAILRDQMMKQPKGILQALRSAEMAGFTMENNPFKRMAVPDQVPETLRALYTQKEWLFVKRPADTGLVFTPAFADTLFQDFTALAPLYRLMAQSYDLARIGGFHHGL